MVINTLKIQVQRYSFRPKTASYSSGFLRLFYINRISTSYKENIQIILLYDILLIKDIYYICNEMLPILGMQKNKSVYALVFYVPNFATLQHTQKTRDRNAYCLYVCASHTHIGVGIYVAYLEYVGDAKAWNMG